MSLHTPPAPTTFRRVRRQLLGHKKKADYMCPPGIPLCIEHKRKREASLFDQRKELAAQTQDELARKREEEEHWRKQGEEALAAEARQKELTDAAAVVQAKDIFSGFMLRRQTKEKRQEIISRREKDRTKHRTQTLAFLRQRLLEESKWEEAERKASTALAAEAARQEAMASGEAAAALVPRRKTRKEVEREEMAAWLRENAPPPPSAPRKYRSKPGRIKGRLEN